MLLSYIPLSATDSSPALQKDNASHHTAQEHLQEHNKKSSSRHKMPEFLIELPE